MQIVEQQLAKALVGVTPNQLQRGLALFYASTNTYMPNFAEFRAMCMGTIGGALRRLGLRLVNTLRSLNTKSDFARRKRAEPRNYNLDQICFRPSLFTNPRW